MHTTTMRMVIGAAALAGPGLFGSLPHEGATVAQQGVPTVHRDVALVDASDTIVTTEISLDDTRFTEFFGTSGAEADVYNGVASLFGGEHTP